MKALITIFTTLILLLIAHQSMASSECTYKGALKVRASDEFSARRELAIQCTDRQLDKILKRNNKEADEEQSLMIAESCTNDVTCKTVNE